MDLHSCLVALQEQPKEHVDPLVVEFHVEAHRGIAVPAQIDMAGKTERDGAGLEVHFGRGIDQRADVAVALRPDEGDEIGRIDQAKLGRDLLQPVRHHPFTLMRKGASLPQHPATLYLRWAVCALRV